MNVGILEAEQSGCHADVMGKDHGIADFAKDRNGAFTQRSGPLGRRAVGTGENVCEDVLDEGD